MTVIRSLLFVILWFVFLFPPYYFFETYKPVIHYIWIELGDLALLAAMLYVAGWPAWRIVFRWRAPGGVLGSPSVLVIAWLNLTRRHPRKGA